MILLFPRHIRKGGYCMRGARAWAERYNINYMQFAQHGIDVEVIEKVGDAFAMHVCQIAREEHAANEGASDGQE